jgi:hypothetical protein
LLTLFILPSLYFALEQLADRLATATAGEVQPSPAE